MYLTSRSTCQPSPCMPTRPVAPTRCDLLFHLTAERRRDPRAAARAGCATGAVGEHPVCRRPRPCRPHLLRARAPRPDKGFESHPTSSRSSAPSPLPPCWTSTCFKIKIAYPGHDAEGGLECLEEDGQRLRVICASKSIEISFFLNDYIFRVANRRSKKAHPSCLRFASPMHCHHFINPSS